MEEVSLQQLTLDNLNDMIFNKQEVLKRQEFDEKVEREIYEWELHKSLYRRDDMPLGFVLQCRQRMVGSVVLVPAVFKVGREHLYAALENDLMVQSDFRFYGLRLLNKVWSSGLFPLVISTTPNAVSYAIEKRLGSIDLTFTSYRYIKITDIVNSMSKFSFKFGYIPRFIGSIFCGFMNRLSEKEDFEIREIVKFDDSITRFCDELDYDVMHVRDSSYLNWRYVEYAFGRRKIFAILDKKKDVRGFTVIQMEKENGMKSANILELITRKNDMSAMKALLNFAEEFAKRNKINIVTIMPPSMSVKKVLDRTGFIKKKLRFPACSFKFCIERSSIVSEVIYAADNWYLSSGDGDTAMYSAMTWDEE